MQALGQAIEILNEQYQACEMVKYDVAALGGEDTPEATKQTFLVSEQSLVVTDLFILSWVACSKS